MPLVIPFITRSTWLFSGSACSYVMVWISSEASSENPLHKNIHVRTGPTLFPSTKQAKQSTLYALHTLPNLTRRNESIWREDDTSGKRDEEVEDSPLAAAIKAWSCSASVGGWGQGPVPMATSGPPVALWQKQGGGTTTVNNCWYSLSSLCTF